MKLQIPQTVSNSSTLEDIIRFSANCIDKIKTIINGNVDLIENGNNQLVDFTFTKINIEVGVPHGLGRTPRGFVNVGSNNTALVLAKGATDSTSNTLYVQAGSTGTVTVMVF